MLSFHTLLPFSTRVLLIGAIAVVAVLSSVAPRAQAVPSLTDVRALWVTRATLASPQLIERMVRSAEAAGFNTLLVQVRGRGDAYYSSSLEPRAADIAARPDFDPLAVTIERARAAGLRVHAWVAVNLVSSAATLPAARTHLIYQHPEWLMVPRALAAELRQVDPKSPEYLGRIARWSRAHADEVEGLYISPVHQGAAQHAAAVAREIVERYDVDGLHLDYVRYPGEAFDYGRSAIQEFKAAIQPDLSASDQRSATVREAIDPLAYPSLFKDRWDGFRRSRLTALVMRVRTAVKAARPDVVLSAAVVPDVQVAQATRMQDWRAWLDQSLIDALCPMAYSQDPRVFEEQVIAAREYAGDRPVWAGIGAYRLSRPDTLQYIAAARRLGTAGIALFSYDALVAPPHTAATFTDLGRAAFGTTAGQ